MANMYFVPFRPAYDSAGVVVPGSQHYFTDYETGLPVAPYQDADLTVPHSNPVVANAAGLLPAVYLDEDVDYRVRIYDENATVGVGTPLEDYNPYFVYGAAAPSGGGGGDAAALEAALAAATGGSKVGLLDGTSLADNIFAARRLFYANRVKQITLRQARIIADDIHNQVVGYAKTAGTTGGAGKTHYFVDRTGMDPANGTPSAISATGIASGSYAYCRAQAFANGGGIIIFYPTGHHDPIIRDDQENRFDIGEDNITVIAPGRNAILWHVPLTGSSVVKNINMITAYISYRTLPGPSSGDFEGSGAKVEKGLNSVHPQHATKQAWIGCTWDRASDGAWDVAATAFDPTDPACYITNQDFLFRNTDEVSLLGGLSNTATTSDARNMFVTLYNGVFDGCGQRMPKVLAYALVDMCNVYTQAIPWRRDQPSPVLEYGSVHGASVQNGGHLLIRGCLFTVLDEVAGREATKLTPNPISGQDGAIRVVDCAGEFESTYAEKLPGTVADPPYLASLPHTAPPAAGVDREAWIADRWQAAGAEIDPAPEGIFHWDVDSTDYPDQTLVVRRRGPDGTFLPGREIRIDARSEVPLDPGPSGGVSALTVRPRGYTHVVGLAEGKGTRPAIGATFLDLTNADASYFAVQGNGGAANLKHVVFTDGTLPSDSVELFLMGGSSSVVTLKSSTSATVTVTTATDIINHTSHGETTSGFQVVFSTTGTMPDGLEAGVPYYGIYVSGSTYKVAASYPDAIAGTAIDITSTGVGTLTATLGSFTLAAGLDVALDSSAKVAHLIINPSNWRYSLVGASW